MARQTNRFGQGGCYTCESCQRKTRYTGQGVHHFCGECFEAMSIANEMSDEGETPERLADWKALVDDCKAKGGKPSEDKWWR